MKDHSCILSIDVNMSISDISDIYSKGCFPGFPGVAWAPRGSASWPHGRIGVAVGICALQASAHRGEIAQLKKGAADGA